MWRGDEGKESSSPRGYENLIMSDFNKNTNIA